MCSYMLPQPRSHSSTPGSGKSRLAVARPRQAAGQALLHLLTCMAESGCRQNVDRRRSGFGRGPRRGGRGCTLCAKAPRLSAWPRRRSPQRGCMADYSTAGCTSRRAHTRRALHHSGGQSEPMEVAEPAGVGVAAAAAGVVGAATSSEAARPVVREAVAKGSLRTL